VHDLQTSVGGVTVPSSPASSNPPSTSRKRQCVALYDCDADNDDELSFREGELINIISEDEEEWWVSVADRMLNILCRLALGILWSKGL